MAGFKRKSNEIHNIFTHKSITQTIVSYLSALSHYHIMNRMEWKEIRYDPLIKQMLKTIEGNHMFTPV